MVRTGFAAAGGLMSLLLLLDGSALGHGFTLSQINGQLVLDTQGNVRPFRVGYVPTFDPITNQPIINDSGNRLTFVHELDAANSMNHGAFGLVADVTDQLDLNDNFILQSLGTVWSSAGSATRAQSELGLRSFAPGNVPLDSLTITQASSGGLLDVSAHSSHSIIWTLEAGAPEGVYGVAYRVLWDDALGASQFEASNWITLLMVTPGFLNNPNLLAAEQSVVAAAVPEPATLGIFAMGLAVIGWHWRRRRGDFACAD